MERKANPYAKKREAQRLYEQEGLSFAKIADAVGVHENTVSGWRKKEGWAEKGSKSADAVEVEEVQTVVEDDLPIAPTPSVRNDQELVDRVRELEAANADLERRVEQLRPDVDITVMLFKTEEDLAKVYTDQHWEDLAQLQFESANAERRLRGLKLLEWTPAELEREISRLKQEELASRQKEAWGPPDKRLKMVKPHKDPKTKELSYWPPHIVQLPYESQVNNVAGSLADGIVRYTRKGYKMTSPFLCPRRNCFRPAAIDAATRDWAFDGYCSHEHYVAVEKPQNPNQQRGVTTKDLIGGLAASSTAV